MKKMRVTKQFYVGWVLFFVCLAQVQAASTMIPAFSGAEGYGVYSEVGRGGKVLHVTTLEDKGPGSLRWAVELEGPRTIVFGVSGTIELKGELTIRNPFITIAGQTAPANGICIIGNLGVTANYVIIQYICVRANSMVETDAIGGLRQLVSDID